VIGTAAMAIIVGVILLVFAVGFVPSERQQQ
jgi:hypothetical protein